MTRSERALYHQVHPAKIAADAAAALVSSLLLWRGRLMLGLAARYLPAIIASAIVMTRTADLERIRDSAIGAKVRVEMTPARQLVRVVGDLVIAVGAWRHRPRLMAAGATVMGLAWASAFGDQVQPIDPAAPMSPWDAARDRIRI